MRDPEPEAEQWHNILAEIGQERDGYIRLAAKGRIPETALDAYLSELDQQTATIKERLADIDGRRERIQQLEQDKAELIRANHGRASAGGLAEFTPKQRRDVYTGGLDLPSWPVLTKM
jgi:L-amino acid N-acyltransferase YncA